MIDNTQDVIDSRDVIEEIERLEADIETINEELEELTSELEEGQHDNTDERVELNEQLVELREQLLPLKALEADAVEVADWIHGETLIRDSYFTDYITELIKDCYEMPKNFDSGNWPWRHMHMDFEAAAEEAKQDYFEVDYDGVTYWIR